MQDDAEQTAVYRDPRVWPLEARQAWLVEKRQKKDWRRQKHRHRAGAAKPSPGAAGRFNQVEAEHQIHQSAEEQIDVRGSVHHPGKVAHAGQVVERAIHVLPGEDEGNDAADADGQVELSEHEPREVSILCIAKDFAYTGWVMDERTRRFAHAHWSALDAAMTRTFSPDQVDWCREAFRWSVSDIAAKYVERLVAKTGDDTASSGIETVERELAATLIAEWESQGSDPAVR